MIATVPRHVGDFIRAHLATIAAHLAVDAKLTLVVRVPENPDTYIVIGNDELVPVIETVRRALRDAEGP